MKKLLGFVLVVLGINGCVFMRNRLNQKATKYFSSIGPVYRYSGEPFVDQEFAYSRNDTDYFDITFYPPVDSSQTPFEVGSWRDFPFKDYNVMSISKDGSVFLMHKDRGMQRKLNVANFNKRPLLKSGNNEIIGLKSYSEGQKYYVYEWQNPAFGRIGYILSDKRGFIGFFKADSKNLVRQFGADLNGNLLFQ